jgi:hypothetical protein
MCAFVRHLPKIYEQLYSKSVKEGLVRGTFSCDPVSIPGRVGNEPALVSWLVGLDGNTTPLHAIKLLMAHITYLELLV